MSDPASVGIIVNPLSGRDVRRLVANASVFDNAEKGSMVFRLLAGLGASGVDRVLMMPAAEGVSGSLSRRLERSETARLPVLETLDMECQLTAEDTGIAAQMMVDRGVAAVVVLGGDGTHRVAAKHIGDAPLCPMSTGTNNAFSRIVEATVAGLATGFVATGRVKGPDILRREKILTVSVNGAPDQDCALVDVAFSADRWVGARALWQPESLSELVVSFANPDGLGLSAVAGQLEALPRSGDQGLHIRLGDPEQAPMVVSAAIAPGLIVPVGVVGSRRVEPGESITIAPGGGCVALDGEREIELGRDDRVEVHLSSEGPLTIAVDQVMAEAADRGLLRAGRPQELVD